MNCRGIETSPECPSQKLQLSLLLFLNITAEILSSNLGKLFKQQMNLFCLKLHCYKMNKLIDCSSIQEKEILILVPSHQLYVFNVNMSLNTASADSMAKELQCCLK